jgi:hypothetical protein
MAGTIDWSDLLITGYQDIKSMLTDLYITQKMGLKTIGDFLGIDKDPVRKKLLSYGIPLNAKGRPGPNNKRIERKQGKNRPKDTQEEKALKQLAYKLNMRPDAYNPIETRKSEKRDCPKYESCLSYVAILHGWVIPCSNCDGTPSYLASMERALRVFEEQFFSLPEIVYRRPGCAKPVREERGFGYKYLEWKDEKEKDI